MTNFQEKTAEEILDNIQTTLDSIVENSNKPPIIPFDFTIHRLLKVYDKEWGTAYADDYLQSIPPYDKVELTAPKIAVEDSNYTWIYYYV